METGLPPIVTRRRLWKHNLCCVGRAILFLIGAISIVVLLMIVGWILWGIPTGQMNYETLSASGWTFMSVFAVYVFWKGYRECHKEGSSPWNGLEMAVGIEPGARISRKMHTQMMALGGLTAYVQLGPRWMMRVAQEWRSWISVSPEKVAQLEDVRRHFAARESWEPIEGFPHHKDSLRELAALQLVAIREYCGAWCVRVSLEGQTKHEEKDLVDLAD